MNSTITIHEAKRIINGHNLIVKDVSGPNAYGYDFAIYRTEHVDGPIPFDRAVGEPLVTSTTVHESETINKLGKPGAYRQVFNRADVEALIN